MQLKTFLAFLFLSWFVAIVLGNCTSPDFIVQGQVFVEAANSDPADTNYNYAPGSGVEVRSGSVSVTTSANGTFELRGDTTPGLILIEAAKSGYQTAYLYVDIESIANWSGEALEDSYEQTIQPQSLIKLKAGGSIDFVEVSPAPSISVLNGEAANNKIILFLLKAPEGDDWNVFEYAEPSRD